LDKNDVEYFYYAFSSFTEQFDLYGSGTTFKEISADAFVNFPIPYPGPETQRGISEYLRSRCSEIDALIAAKEKTNALLKERRQSIIYEAVTKGLNPDAPMKDSGIEWIGEIPTDWDVCPIKYLLDKNHPYPIGDGDHGMIKADDYLSEGIPYIRVLNLTWGDGLNLETLVYISEEMNNRIKNSELKPNDILIAKTGATIGKTAIVPASLPRSNTTSHVGKITISGDHDPKFFYYVKTSSIIQTQIKMLSAMQSTRPELGIDGLRNLLTVVPPVERQREIAEYLDHQCTELNSAITTNASVLEKLKEYRQSIIYEAVTGKIEI
jgi:type I restriction enzyme S subunit